MKQYFRKVYLLILSLFCGITLLGQIAHAASFNLTASTKQVAPGATFTVSVGGDCIGRINLKATNGSIADPAVWVEENYQTVTITAGSSGTVTVTATPEVGLSDSNGDEYKPGSRTVTVNIVAPAQNQPSTTPNNPSNSSNSSNSANTSKPATPTKPSSSSSNSTNSNNPTNQNQPNANDSNSKPAESSETGQDDKPEATTTEINNTSTEIIADNNCSEQKCNSILAWVITAICAILFFCTFGILTYILSKFQLVQKVKPKAKPTSEKPKPKKATANENHS